MITCWMISSVRSFYDLGKVKDVTRWIWSLFSYNGHKQLEVRFLLWMICGREIFVLSSGVACARTIGSLRTICSFCVIMRKSMGFVVCLWSIGICPSGWWICWLVGRGDLVNISVLIHGGLFHCMWTIWREWNQRTYFLIRGWALVCGAKTFFYYVPFVIKWLLWVVTPFSLEHFLDLCKFRWLL